MTSLLYKLELFELLEVQIYNHIETLIFFYLDTEINSLSVGFQGI